MLRGLVLLLGLALTVPLAKAGESIELSTKNVVRVYDGDTITVNLPGLPPVFGDALGVRISGIDTPELVSHCTTPVLKAAEKYKAQQARQVVEDLVLKGNTVVLSELDRDKYFRLLAKVSVDGVDVGALLIQQGLADSYDGGTKISWCGR